MLWIELTYHPDAAQNTDPDSGLYFMRIRMRIFYADPNLFFHADADPDSVPRFQIKAQTL